MAFLIGQPGVFPLLAGALETARLKSMAFKPLKLQCPSALSWAAAMFQLESKGRASPRPVSLVLGASRASVVSALE